MSLALRPTPLAGHVLGGRFEVLGALARGGMGEVLVARQHGIDGFEKLVVIKTIARERADDQSAVDMFLDEARIAADLRHPNIVSCFEVAKDDDIWFIAMELLEGASTSKLLAACKERGRRFPLGIALHIIRDAAAGLAYAHEKTDLSGRPLCIVHRDVSPQNIVVTYAGTSKIVDFGIAKARSRTFVTDGDGAIKGKLPYMSPEQANAEELDARSDQFSLGVVLYEMTTMTSLFARGSEVKTLRAVVDCDVPEPSSFIEDYPRQLEKVLLKALSKKASDRFASCTEFARALEDVEEGWSSVVRPAQVGAFVREVLGEVSAPPADVVTETGSAPRGYANAASLVLPSATTVAAESTRATVATPKRRRRSPIMLGAATLGGLAALAVGASALVVAQLPPTSQSPAPSTTTATKPTTTAVTASAAATTTPTTTPTTTATTPATTAAPDPTPTQASTPAGSTQATPTQATPTQATPTHAPRAVHPAHGESTKSNAAHPETTSTSAAASTTPPTADAATTTAVGQGTAELRFSDANPYYKVSVDGAALGASPLRKSVSAGKHVVELRSPATDAIVETVGVDVNAGDVRVIAAGRGARSP